MSDSQDAQQHEVRRAREYPTDDPTLSQSYSGATGQLPVWGAPASAAPAVTAPRGPYLPSVIRGVFVLVLAACVVVWRLVDHPDWAAVGIGFGIGAGVLFLVAAVASFAIQRARREHEFDDLLSGS